MAASNTDLITDVRNATRPNSARVSSGRSPGGATLACDNLTGWPTASKVHFVTYQIDSNSNPVAGTQLDCYGIRSGNNITSLVVVDGTDAGNAVNDVVEMLPTAAWGQDLAAALTSQHSRTGAHTVVTATSVTTTGGVTSGGTLTASGGLTVTGSVSLPASSIPTASLANASVTADKLSTGTTTASVATSEGTASSYAVDLATTGPSATVTIGANGIALVVVSSQCASNTNLGKSFLGVDISGATTTAASVAKSVSSQTYTGGDANGLSGAFLYTGLAAGSTTFKLKYGTNGTGTSTYSSRTISVLPL